MVKAPFAGHLLSGAPKELIRPPLIRAARSSVLRFLGDASFEIECFGQLIRDLDHWPSMPMLRVAILDLLKILEGCIERVVVSVVSDA